MLILMSMQALLLIGIQNLMKQQNYWFIMFFYIAEMQF